MEREDNAWVMTDDKVLYHRDLFGIKAFIWNESLGNSFGWLG